MLSRWLLETRLNKRTLQLHKLQPSQGGVRLAETGLSGLSACMSRGLSACASVMRAIETMVGTTDTANGYERQGGEAIYGGFLVDLIPVYDYGRILPNGILPNGSEADVEYNVYIVGGDDDPRRSMTHKTWGNTGSNLSIFGTFTTAYTRTFSQSRIGRWRTRRFPTGRACT